MIDLAKIPLDSIQKILLAHISRCVELIEDLGHSGKLTQLLCLLKELSEGVVSPYYLEEHLNLLFDRFRFNLEDLRE